MQPLNPLRRVAVAFPTAGLLAVMPSCDEDKPYTPFQVASELPQVEPAPSASVLTPRAKPSEFTARPATRAPKDADTWRFEDRDLKAPPGRKLESAVAADFDADGATEVVVWTTSGDETAPPGELWLFPPKGKPRKISALPGFVPTGPGCELVTQLTHSGPSTVTLDSAARCTARLVQRSPIRAVSVLGPTRESPELLTLRVTEAAPGELLRVRVVTSDLDEDGSDDIELLVSVGRKQAARYASAKLVWFDRAAGIAREAKEPRQSLVQLASTEKLRAKGKNTGRQVAQAVENLGRLYASLCAESGTPRVFDSEGAPFKCGELSGVWSDARAAQVTAAVKTEAPLQALAVFEQDGWRGGPMSDEERGKLRDQLLALLPHGELTELRRLGQKPMRASHAPHRSPLDFDKDALLIQTPIGIVRWPSGAESAEPVDPEGNTTAWSLDVSSAEGKRWTGVILSCDRSEAQLTFERAGQALDAIPLVQLLAPRPGVCAGKAAAPSPRLTPLGYRGGQVRALIAGVLSEPDGEDLSVAVGSGASDNGQHWIAATALGVWVRRGGKDELWRVPDDLPARDLAGCVIDDAGTSAACTLSNDVVRFRRPKELKP